MKTDNIPRKTDAGDYYPISSPGAFGSGELKNVSNETSLPQDNNCA